MNNKAVKIVATVLNYLLGLILIATGTMKLIGLEEYVKTLNELNPYYVENITLIGVLGLATGILFIIPRTFTYGWVAALVYFGGTVSAHMQHGDNYLPQVIFVLLTITVAHLKIPEWFRKGLR